MARSQAVQIENSFIKGLITENTALNFPENACAETFNCVFDETGRVTRRPGIDIEDGYTLGSIRTFTRGQAYSEYVWSNVAGLGTKSFFVQQEGNFLVFWEISSDATVSLNGQSAVFTLTDFRAPGQTFLPLNAPCQFASGTGYLLVVNPTIDPLRITYNTSNGQLEAEVIKIRYRDFEGIAYEDAAYDEITYRPAFATMSDMKADSPDGIVHFYNLLNQGWWQGGITSGSPDSNSALGQWDTARTDMPSNADRVSFFRASETDAFDAARVDSNEQGNTPAVKGHFILELGNADRRAALEADDYTVSFTSSSDSTVSFSTGTVISGIDASALPAGSLENAFDGSGAQIGYFQGNTDSDVGTSSTGHTVSTTSTAIGYVGKNYGGSPKRIVSVSVEHNPEYFGLSTSGTALTSFGSSRTFGYSGTITLYGSVSTAPTSPTDGTILGIANFTSGNPATTVVFSSDTATSYQYVWVAINYTATCTINGLIGTNIGISSWRAIWYINEATFTERIDSVIGEGSLPSADITPERPSAVTFFAGRAWYGGVGAERLSNNIYFSQIIEKPEQFGRCYQNNDPTSEQLFDILDSDGGVIQIPEMGKLIRLATYQNALFAFATNGIWYIRGSGNSGFTPTSFVVRKLDSRGTQSPLSFVDVKGLPMWWGEDAIYQLDYNPQFDSYTVLDLTEETIRRFYTDVPAGNRRYAKGAYDVRNGLVYWLYSSGDNFAWEFDSVLVFNSMSKAFYPWTISDSTPRVHGICYSQDSVGFSEPKIAFTCSHPVTPTSICTFYADLLSSDSPRDWVSYAQNVSLDENDAKSYESYFITGYSLSAEAMKFHQSNYVMVFLEQEDGAGAYIQGIFDFTNNQASGKWTMKQQLYNSSLLHRDIIYRRLKIRGKGRSLQFKILNAGDAPFTIIGWAAFKTANTEL